CGSGRAYAECHGAQSTAA
ncbi:MAG: SEC-C domain-containing protein, partial [Caldilineaceae bacterium]|nr:SEC-C domain-containing protein [Caldilineaceae bacterium]